MAKTHRVLLITTGGTIAGQVAVGTRDKAVKRTAEAFASMIAPAVSYLNTKHDLDVTIEPDAYVDVDSSDIMPTHWVALASRIKERFDAFDSFIITHGTNTLGYTCAALSFALPNPGKPIIVTGSQVSAGLPGSDGLTNLENALRVATWPRGANPMRGVMAVFGSHIITGTRVKKDTEFDYDAFKSFSAGSLGRIGRIIKISEPNLSKHLSYLHTSHYPEATEARDLLCVNDFDMRIASLTEFPGMATDLFRSLVTNNGIRGFILRAFGAGDASTAHRAAFEYLRSEEIPVVVTTQAPNGNSNFQVNQPGKMLRDQGLAIPAYDMSIEAQTTKLAWLLAKRCRDDISYARLCDDMVTDLRGEIDVTWEVSA